MRLLCAFYGIVIYVYARDHGPAHIGTTDPSMSSRDRTPVVVGVAVIEPQVMRLLFDDGAVRDIEYVVGGAHGSLLEPLGDPACFAQVRVDPEVCSVDVTSPRRVASYRHWRARHPAGLLPLSIPDVPGGVRLHLRRHRTSRSPMSGAVPAASAILGSQHRWGSWTSLATIDSPSCCAKAGILKGTTRRLEDQATIDAPGGRAA